MLLFTYLRISFQTTKNYDSLLQYTIVMMYHKNETENKKPKNNMNIDIRDCLFAFNLRGIISGKDLGVVYHSGKTSTLDTFGKVLKWAHVFTEGLE